MSFSAADLEIGVRELYDLQSRIEEIAGRLCPAAFGAHPYCAVRVRIAGDFLIPERVKVYGTRGDLVLVVTEYRDGMNPCDAAPGDLRPWYRWTGDEPLEKIAGAAVNALRDDIRRELAVFPTVASFYIDEERKEREEEDSEWV